MMSNIPSLSVGSDYSKISSSLNSFTGKLWQSFKDQDFVFSPFSIYLAMNMVLMGARKETLHQLLNGLSIDEYDLLNWKQNHLLPYMEQVNAELQNDQTLSMANRIFLKKDVELKDEFQQDLNQIFKSPTQLCDFEKPNEETEIINKWVETKTNSLITDLLPKDSIKENTVMVLVNAVHFLGSWQCKFEQVETNYDFNTNHGKIKCSMMKLFSTDVQYGEDVQCKWITLPYIGNQYEMMFILPNSESDINFDNWLIENLKNGGRFDTQYENVYNIFIPKFKSKFSKQLTDTFKEKPFEMTKPFEYDGDFSGIVESVPIHISQIIHKAFVDVNENGTEAAAATAVEVSCDPCCSRPKTFIVDRPFVYILKHVQTNSIIFIGKCTNPEY